MLPLEYDIAEYLFSLPSYKRYSELTQIIDLIILDIEHNKFQPLHLVLSSIFCTLVLSLHIMSPVEMYHLEIDTDVILKEITSLQSLAPGHLAALDEPSTEVQVTQSSSQNSQTSPPIDRHKHFCELQSTYSHFLKEEFGTEFVEIVPSIEYVSTFAGILQICSSTEYAHVHDLPRFQPGTLHVDQNVRYLHNSFFLL